MSQRLDLLGVETGGAGWRVDDGGGYLEVALDPYSEETAQRVRLMCAPVEVRFIEGPLRPRWGFDGGFDARIMSWRKEMLRGDGQTTQVPRGTA